MKKYWVGLVMGFFLGAAGLTFAWLLSGTTKATSINPVPSGPKRILVPFMHMRGIGGGAGHESKPGEAILGAGTEIEIWNISDKELLTITEIYFTTPDGNTTLEGSKYGLPLPLELKPKTHYHFSSFYEHFKLPVPTLTEGRKNFIHGYMADVRWKGPAPRVRGWDKGVKNGDYIMVTPVTIFEE
jgi:hypothetical protein